VQRVLAQARVRFAVGVEAPVVSCYEAGRDGFWIHRALTVRGIQNRVVDSASIEVNRRARRTKTDRLDATKLVLMLVRAVCGEPHVWREVRVPSVEAEAARQVSRERSALVAERTRLENQIQSWLATWGCTPSRRTRQAPEWWTTVVDWAGALLPATVQARIARAEARRAVLRAQLATLEAAQAAATAAVPATSALGRLVRLRGIATTSAAVLVEEAFGWRAFQNRREVGGLVGLAPTRWASGELVHDQGVSRAGNRQLKAVSIQLAWGWVRWQPDSALTRWYHTHFGDRPRARRLGIVALARKLLIALWRYVQTGAVPHGAVVKALP
jgi:transposase